MKNLKNILPSCYHIIKFICSMRLMSTIQRGGYLFTSKRNIALLFFGLSFAVAMMTGCLAQENQEKVIEIPDDSLKTAISNKVGKSPEGITASDMESINSLTLTQKNISDLTGLEYATNLEELYLYYNDIEDIAPLAYLTNLQDLRLNDNRIEDIGPLSVLSELKRLQLCRNQITDLDPVKDLTSLEELYMTNEKVAAPGDHTENEIEDIRALGKLQGLTTLHLNGNQITDISAIKSLTELKRLRLGDNELEEIDALADLEKLQQLGLARNNIYDISALIGLSELRELDLGYNSITDFTPITALRKLETLRVTDQPVNVDALSEQLESENVTITDADFLRD